MAYIRKYLYFSYHICSLFGVTPFYSFVKQSPIYKIMNSFIPPFLIFYSVSLFIILYKNSFIIKGDGTSTLYVTEMMSIGTYCFMPIATSTVFFYKRWHWMRFNKKFLEAFDNIKTVYSHKCFSLIMVMVLFHLLVFSNILFRFMKPDTPHLISMYLCIWDLAILYSVILIILINRNIKVFYKNLQDVLVKICEEAIKDKINIYDSDTVTVFNLKEIFAYYVDVTELVNGVSDLFGWTIVQIFAYAFTSSIAFLNRYVSGVKMFPTDLLDLFVTLTLVVSITLSCDFTASEGKQFITAVYDTEEKFGLTAPTRLELVTIAEQGIYYLPNFTLFGLITINRSINLNLVSILTTYMIVVIQFNISYK